MNRQKRTEQQQDGIQGKDYVLCPVCGARRRQLVEHMKLIHGISVSEFRETYPMYPLICEDSHILNAKQGKTGSDMQNRLYNYLHAWLGDAVVAEYRLISTYLDIAVPAVKVAIEVDGTYFHNKENTGRPITATQMRVEAFDHIKESILDQCGWRLIRVTDEQLMMNPAPHIREIADALAGLGTLFCSALVDDDITLIPDKVRFCKRCSAPLTYKQIYSGKSFCKKACRTAYFREHPEMLGCMNCGRIPATLRWRSRRFCCEDCKQEYLETHAKQKSSCLYCHAPLYTVNQEPIVFCGRDCMRKLREERPDEWLAYRSRLSADSEYNVRRRSEGRVEFTCPICGTRSWKHRRSLKKSKSGLLFCSSSCYMEYRKRLNEQKKEAR